MVPGMNSRVHPKCKVKYRVSNRIEHSQALVQRGDITLLLAGNNQRLDCKAIRSPVSPRAYDPVLEEQEPQRETRTHRV